MVSGEPAKIVKPASVEASSKVILGVKAKEAVCVSVCGAAGGGGGHGGPLLKEMTSLQKGRTGKPAFVQYNVSPVS